MIGLLRITRGFIGFFLLASIADILNLIIQKANNSSIEYSVTDSLWFGIFYTDSVLQIIIIGVIAIIIFGALFMGLRNLINSMHHKINGKPHPSLTTVWSL